MPIPVAVSQPLNLAARRFNDVVDNLIRNRVDVTLCSPVHAVNGSPAFSYITAHTSPQNATLSAANNALLDALIAAEAAGHPKDCTTAVPAGFVQRGKFTRFFLAERN